MKNSGGITSTSEGGYLVDDVGELDRHRSVIAHLDGHHGVVKVGHCVVACEAIQKGRGLHYAIVGELVVEYVKLSF